jgi:uncharacterized membrane protein YqjE
VSLGLGGGLRKLAAAYLAIARQRLELAALDVEEELLRAALLVAALLACVALAGLALAAAAATIVVLWWDSARIAALVCVTLFFFLAAAFVGWRVSLALRTKPAFLAATLAELRKDFDRISTTAR